MAKKPSISFAILIHVFEGCKDWIASVSIHPYFIKDESHVGKCFTVSQYASLSGGGSYLNCLQMQVAVLKLADDVADAIAMGGKIVDPGYKLEVEKLHEALIMLFLEKKNFHGDVAKAFELAKY